MQIGIHRGFVLGVVVCAAGALVGCADHAATGTVVPLPQSEADRSPSTGSDEVPATDTPPVAPDPDDGATPPPDPGVVDPPTEETPEEDLALCLTRAEANPVDWVRFDLGSHASASRLEVVGDVALVADGYGTSTAWWLHVLELDAAAGPSLQATFEEGDKWAGSQAGYDLLVDGDVAYVATLAGITVLDVSVPGSPEVMTLVEVGPVSRLARHGDRLVGDRWTGLVVLDVSSPEAPALVGDYELLGGGLVMDGARGYRLDSDEVVQILDTLADGGPATLGTYEPGEIVLSGLAAGDDVLYLVDGEVDPEASPPKPNATLRVIDVSDPAAPVLLGSAPVPFLWSYSLWLQGDVLYVNGGGELRRFDVSDPAAPQAIGPPLLGCSGRVTTSSQHLQLACGGQVRMVAQPFETPLGTVPVGIGGGAADVVAWGEHAYVATGQGVEVFDVSEPELPVQTAFYSGFNGFTTSVLVHDGYLIVGEHPKVRVLSLTEDPAAPPVVATIDVTGGPSSYLAMSGDTLVITTAQKELGLVDLADPTSPGAVAWVPLPQEGKGSNDTIARAVATADGFAYVGSVTGTVTVLSLADPAAPAVVTVLEAASEGRILDIEPSDTRLYVRSETALDVYDRSEPSAPVFLASFDHLSTGGKPSPGWKKDRIAVHGNLVLLTDRSDDANLKVIDVTDPSDVVEVFTDAYPDTPRGVTVAGDLVYITTAERLTIRRLCELAP